MLGRRTQRGLFDSDYLFADVVVRDRFYRFLAEQRGTLFRDEEFAEFYHDRIGRPSVPPSLLATALVLQTYSRSSDEEATERATYDLRWKIALGVELREQPFAKSTLQLFRAQLVVHERAQAIFRRSLELAMKRGLIRHGKLRVALDTTAILGRGAVHDTYNLLGDGIMNLARALADLEGMPVEAWGAEAGLGRYLGSSLKGESAIDWDEPKQRQALLRQIVADADRLLGVAAETAATFAPESAAAKSLHEAATLLRQVLLQDIERVPPGPNDEPPSGGAPERQPRIRQGVARDRMPSVVDSEMRHGHKSAHHRFNGHKAQVAVDTESQLITAVDVLPGNAPDHDQALEMVTLSEELTGLEVEDTVGDHAYGDGATRRAFVDAGRSLIAPVAVIRNHGRFPKTDFVIDIDEQRCTCPAGHHTTQLSHARAGGGVFHFPARLCAECPLRAQCVRGKAGRSVALHAEEALLQAAREFQEQPAMREHRLRRQTVEHRLARLVQLGIRQARYFGRAKTTFQLLLAATVANLTLIAYGAADRMTAPGPDPLAAAA
jgi:transposase